MEGWSSKPLREVCTFQRGLTYAKSDEVDSPGHTVLRANNIDLASHKLDFSELKFIAQEISVAPSKFVQRGSLLICTASGSKAHLGKVAYIDSDYGYAYGGFMGQITPLQDVDGRFLFYALIAPAYKNFIDELSDGVNINNLKFDDLGRFEVQLPPLSEQRRIVAILDEAFDAIATAKANAEKNSLSAQALLAEVVERTFRDGVEDWSSSPLGAIGRTQTGSTPKSSEPECYGHDLPFIKPGDFQPDGALDYENDGLSALGASRARTVPTGSALMVCIGATIGKAGFCEKPIATNQQINAWTPTGNILPKFIYYQMTTRDFQRRVRENAGQATLPIINKGKWSALQVVVPSSIEEQLRIVRSLDDIQAETRRLAEIMASKLTALDELKKSLLHQAFTGKLTAKNTDKQLEAVA